MPDTSPQEPSPAVGEGSTAATKRTYELADDLSWIRCTVCGATSYHPDDVARLWCARCQRFHDGDRPDWWRAGPPPKQILEYVHWQLTGGVSSDAFTMRLLQLMVRADPGNRRRLARAFPHEASALDAWEGAAYGDFELPPLFSEDVGVQVGIDREKRYVRLEITAAGRVVIRRAEDGALLADMDTVIATEQLLRWR